MKVIKYKLIAFGKKSLSSDIHVIRGFFKSNNWFQNDQLII